MDPTQLTTLVQESTAQLQLLHRQLGSSPSDISSSIDALGKALRKAVDSQVDRCQKRVDEIREECKTSQMKINLLNEAFREEGEQVEQEVVQENQPLLQSQALLKSQLLHLESLHASRTSEVQSLLQELKSHTEILGSRFEVPSIQTRSFSATDIGFKYAHLPQSALENLKSLNATAKKEVEERTIRLRTILREIVNLWIELQDPPTGTSPNNLISTDEFEESILISLGLRPIFSQVAPSSPSPRKKSKSDSSPPPSDLEYTFEGFSEASLPDGSPAPEDLKATDEQLSQAEELRIQLEEVKERREMRIQEIYDQLESIWEVCDAKPAEVEEFVLANKGSTQSAVDAYEEELKGMQALKSSMIELFIANSRSTISALWSELHITEQEQEELFPNFFQNLSSPEIGNQEKEDLHIEHEAYVESLKEEWAIKEKVFGKMKQWNLVKEDEQRMKENEKDPNRYKNAKAGDMLKEEKVRKRIKLLKPKLEESLRKEVESWEEETGREFRYDGQRLLEILGAVEKPIAAGSKRARKISTSDNSSVLSASTNSRTSSRAASSRVAPTPLRPGRGVPATPLEGNVAKRQRTASGSVVPSSSTRRAGEVSAPPVSGMGAKARLGSHQQPLQTPTPRNYTHGTPSTGNQFNRQASVQSTPSRLPQPKRFASNASSTASSSNRFGPSKIAAPRSFRPRSSQAPDSNPSSSSSNEVEAPKKGKGRARLSLNNLQEALAGPSDMNGKWSGEMGAPRWPNNQNSADQQRSTSSVSSNQSNVTTLIHPSAGTSTFARKTKRGPSMSLEASLALLASNENSNGMPTIRHVSSDSLASKGGNWAVLDDESGIMEGVLDFDDADDDQDEPLQKGNFDVNDRIEEENESIMF